MNYEVVAIPNFQKELKKLAKKYPSIKNDFASVVHDLERDPRQGNSLGNGCYKIRMAITSKGQGKSGGSRIITFVQFVESTVFLLSIYDKSERENISDKDLALLLSQIPK